MRNRDSASPLEIMLIDQNFQVRYGKRETGNEKGIIISNNSRSLQLKAGDYFEWKAWVNAFRKASSRSNCGPEKERPFNSFSPVREHNRCKFLIDGENYFRKL